MEEVKMTMCKACAGLNLRRSDFERPPFEPEGRYCSVVLTDTLESLQSKQSHCSLCRLFLYAIERNEQENPEILKNADSNTKWELLWMQSSQEYDPFHEASEDMYGSALYPRLNIAGSHDNYSVQLVDENDTSEFLRGRMISNTVNPQMIKGWLDRCYREHGPDCGPVALEMPSHPRTVQNPFIVIDVEHECLVELPDEEKYIVLSYVWGSSNWPRTLESNFETFKQPGVFERHKLPRTISDTVEFVKALNQRYLWVDSLCIIQDHHMKQKLIANMDAVYGHAHLCVIAASGHDANSGLSGWSSNANRLNVVPAELIEHGMRLGVLPFFDIELMSSAHAQRAWTFQEGLLSTKCLVFLNSLVYFCCRSATWREDLHAELGNLVKPFEGANTLGRTLSPWPLRRFQQYITAYTYRNLSFQSDALNAFAGIQKALSRSMDNTRFWYGMPASVFDWALVWSGARGERLTRRQYFPSWSWAGWEGYINMATDHYSEFDHEWLLYRTWIDWYIMDGTGKCVLIWEPQRDGTQRSKLLIRRTEEGNTVIAPDAEEDKSGDEGFLGEESDSELDDQGELEELQPCPQYGWPTEDNLYGRLIHSRHLLCLPPKPASRFSPMPGSLKSGTLCFETVSAKFRIGRSSTGPIIDSLNRSRTLQPKYFTLTDIEGRICGIIWDHEILEIENLPAQVEADILLLSYAAPGTKDPFYNLELKLDPLYQEWSSNDQEPDRQHILDQWHVWDTFNAMLVVPAMAAPDIQERSIYENRGVGLLHKKALEHALTPGPCWKKIYLS